jgi:hypothetical protein
MDKQCCKCKEIKNENEFGKLKSGKNGLRYDCKSCRKQYREDAKDIIKKKQDDYYLRNKEKLLEASKQYRLNNIDTINTQRKEYRSRPEIKQHIQVKNKEYLPIKKEKMKLKRKTDKNFQLSEILRSKIHKMLKNQPTSYTNIIGCDMDFLKKWLEFRFDNIMNWNNLGSYWHIDHILPINKFDLNKPENIKICFHWTNLQPLQSTENILKSDKIIPHYYFNNIINIHRFNQKHTQFMGYQTVSESLQWLRIELRYGKNAPHSDTAKVVSKTDNPQPSSYIRYDKNMEKVQRLNGYGSEKINHLL